jgi:hypothetical protein
LFRHLFGSTNREIHVVTTNYDRLAEYAANQAGFGFTNGFADGFIGTRAGDRSSRVCRYECQRSSRNRVVHVWKVHGSVDWFSKSDDTVYCCPMAPDSLGAFDPVIVTPGTKKYEKTHCEPFRTVIGEADKALSNAAAFLCVGYGFNDAHIHPKLTERILNHNKPVIVLARTLTDAARKTIARLGDRQHLAIEQGASKATSRVFSCVSRNGEDVSVAKLWDLGVFLDTFILTSRR